MLLSTPYIQGNILIYQESGQSTHLLLDTTEWYAWLDTASVFTFRSEYGSFTARKERSGSKRGGEYWKAYCRRHRKLYRTYLGKSTVLSLERLQLVAVALASKGDKAHSLEVQGLIGEIRQPSVASTITITVSGQDHATSSLLKSAISKPWLSSLPIPPTDLIGRAQE